MRYTRIELVPARLYIQIRDGVMNEIGAFDLERDIDADPSLLGDEQEGAVRNHYVSDVSIISGLLHTAAEHLFTRTDYALFTPEERANALSWARDTFDEYLEIGVEEN